MQDVAQREQKAVDLRKELSELESVDQQTWSFELIPSPGRRPLTIYNLVTGEEVTVPLYIGRAALRSGRFTTNKEQAPEYIKGTVPCFLHKDAPEREVLDQIGLAGRYCPAANLASAFARDLHGERKHPNSWKTFQKHLEDVEKREAREAQAKQVEAMLGLATAASGQSQPVAKAPAGEKEEDETTVGEGDSAVSIASVAPLDSEAVRAPEVELESCGHCDYTGSAAQVRGHQASHK